MSVTPSSAIVGVFRDRAIAEQAMDALYNAGFTHEQVRYSAPGSSGGFFEDIKSLFTGSSADNGSVANDLTDIGLSDEEAHYYATEQSNGNIILAVKAPGRGQEAQTLMQQYGALNAQAHTDSLQDTVQPMQHTIDDTPRVAPSSDVAIETTQPMTHDYIMEESQAAHTPDMQEAHPMSTDESSEQHVSHAMDVHDVQAIHKPEAQAAQPVVTEYNTEQHATQFSDDQLVQPNDTTQPMTNTTTQEQGTTTAQPVVGTVDHTDELQSLQAQIASLQQQLQDAKAQLQEAKERESQVRTTRERDQQLQALRQRMQEIQAELEATHAELQETHTRIGQYQ